MDKVFLLEGNFPQRQKVMREIRESMGDCETFYFDNTFKYDHVSQSFTEYSCFSIPRLFIITDIPYMKTIKMSVVESEKNRTKVINELKKDIPLIPEGNTLILNNLGVRSKPLLKIIEEHGKVDIRETQLSVGKAKAWAVSLFKSKEKELNNDALDLLIDYLSFQNKSVDIEKLYLSMKKVEIYIGDKKKVTYDDVYKCCSQSKEFVIWDIYNTLDKKDIGGSLKLIYKYISMAKNLQGEVISMVEQFRWKYNLLLLVKDAEKKGLNRSQIVKELEDIQKLKKVGTGAAAYLIDEEKPKYSSGAIEALFYLRKGTSSIGSYSLGELYLINEAINKVIIRNRTKSTENECFFNLLFIVMVICKKFKKYSQLSFLNNKVSLWGKNERS